MLLTIKNLGGWWPFVVLCEKLLFMEPLKNFFSPFVFALNLKLSRAHLSADSRGNGALRALVPRPDYADYRVRRLTPHRMNGSR